MTEIRKDPAASSPAAMAGGADIAAMSFEQAMAELDRIVRQIEEGRGELDQAITAYERGVQLKKHCESKLKQAEMRIEKITTTAEGGLTASTFDT